MKVKPQVSNIKCEVKQLDFFKEDHLFQTSTP